MSSTSKEPRGSMAGLRRLLKKSSKAIFFALFPSLKHLVFLKYPTTGKAADGFMTLNGFDFPKNIGDGTE